MKRVFSTVESMVLAGKSKQEHNFPSCAVPEQEVVCSALVTFSLVFSANLESTTPPTLNTSKTKNMDYADIGHVGNWPRSQLKLRKKVRKH